MEIIVEIFLEIYMEMMFLIVPEKNISKRQQKIAKILAVLVILALIALAIWGIILIFDYNNLWGIVPIVIAGLLSLAQIIAGCVLYKKNHE